jgi:hypothetical protein
MAGFTVDPDVLGTAAAPVAAVAHGLKQQEHVVTGAVSSASGAAGQGVLVSELHQAAREVASIITAAVAHVDAVSRGLEATARNYRAVDLHSQAGG